MLDNVNYIDAHSSQIQPKPRSGHYRSSRRHYRAGRCAAAVRAFTAARLHSCGYTLVAAAEACGSCVPYVAAADTLLKAENTALIAEVLRGDVQLLVAAGRVKLLADLADAYRKASAADRVVADFARTIGVATLWDDAIAPVI